MSQLVFLGPPGSGKGTQAKMLVDEGGHEHISTGDLLRKEVNGGTELGDKIEGVLDRGELVNDAMVLELLEKNCNLDESDYIFDGFPRNIDQVHLFESFLDGRSRQAFYFNIPAERLVERLLNRRVCESCGVMYNLLFSPPRNKGVCDQCGEKLLCRSDDNENVILKRLLIYNETIGPVLDYYRSRGILSEVAAGQEVNEVFEGLSRVL